MSDDRDLLALLDELRSIAQTGLHWTDSPYDEARYERVLDLVAEHYGKALDVPPSEARDRLAGDLGHVTPNVGARAAVFDDEGRILLVERADEGTWCLPAGFCDSGEHPRETAVREVREETGLVVEPVDLVSIRAREADEHNPHAFVGHVYHCRVAGTEDAVEETRDDAEASHAHEVSTVAYREIDAVDRWHADHEATAREADRARREREDYS